MWERTPIRTVVNMSTYTDNYVNPLEMDVWSLDPNDSKGMIREKGEFMLGLCEQCIGDSLNSRQKSIIDRCVRKLYIDIARSKEKYIPVMSDFLRYPYDTAGGRGKGHCIVIGAFRKWFT